MSMIARWLVLVDDANWTMSLHLTNPLASPRLLGWPFSSESETSHNLFFNFDIPHLFIL